MPKHILVVTSTFPTADADPLPAFVRDQIIALKEEFPDVFFSVLAPHDEFSYPHRSKTQSDENKYYREYRFHYFWPFCFERLTGRGIIPTLKRNRLYYALIPFLVLAEFFALLKYTRNLKPSMIYAHWFTPQGIVSGLVSELTGIPFVYTSHSSDVAILHRIPFVGASLVRYFSKKAQAITVVSRRSLQKLQEFFSNSHWEGIRKKITIIPMGVDINTGAELIVPSFKEQKNILFIGRLVEKKGVQYLLPAYAATRNFYPDISLIIAGNGPWLERLQDQAKELGIFEEGVKFVGYVSGEAKSNLISNCDIFVVPSIIADDGDAEGLPVTLLEGLAAAKICISTYESGADDIMESEVDGFLVPQKNAAALADAFDKALKLPSEAHFMMRKSAQKAASQFSWSLIARRHYKALFDVQDI